MNYELSVLIERLRVNIVQSTIKTIFNNQLSIIQVVGQ